MRQLPTTMVALLLLAVVAIPLGTARTAQAQGTPVGAPSPSQGATPAAAPTTTSAGAGDQSQAQAAASPVELSEILGTWRNSADNSIVKIEELYPGENKPAIGLTAKHDGWGGTFTPGSASTPSHLHFQMDPKFEQMNPNAPEWARKEVEGKLRWFLELDAQGCGPALAGDWYRGEIRWHDKDSSAGGSASAVSHVREVPVQYVKAPPEPEYEGRAAIRVRSAIRRVPFNTADSLYREEPFFVDVILPEDEARKVGMDLTVTLHTEAYDHTSSLQLSSFSPDVHRFAVYTTLEPVTMLHGGGGVHHGMLANLASRLLGPRLMPGDMVGQSGRYGKTDSVTVSYGDVHTSFILYPQPIDQDEARVEGSLRQLEAGFNAAAATSDADTARGLGMKLRMIKNALRIIDDEMTIRDSDHNPYIAYAVGAAYLAMLTDTAAWTPPVPGARPSGAWEPLYPDGRLVPDYRFSGVGYYSNYERTRVDEAVARGKAKAWKVVERGLDDAAIATVQYFISTTGADQFVIIAFGVDMNGQPVDAMGRFLTGLSFGGHLILRGASLAQQVQGEMVQARERAVRSGGSQAIRLAAGEEPEAGAAAGGAAAVAGGSSRQAATGIAAPAVIGAERDLEKVKLPTNLAFTLPGARSITDRLGKAVNFLLQQFDDTCGVVVSESMARDGGAQPLSEGQGMVKAYREARKAYRAAEGVNALGMRDYLKVRGARARAFGRGVAISDMEAELGRGGQVAALVNVAPPGQKSHCHWVRVLGVEHGRSGWPDSVIYGDPWTGTQCRVAACVFRASMIDPEVPAGQQWHQFGVVFAHW